MSVLQYVVPLPENNEIGKLQQCFTFHFLMPPRQKLRTSDVGPLGWEYYLPVQICTLRISSLFLLLVYVL